MNNWQFDTEDLFNHERTTQARSLALVASVALLLFSAITSYAFFSTYAGDVFAFISPTLAPYLAGLAGMVVFEGMTLVWRYLRANHADTHDQMAYAKWGAILALSGGVLVTVVYFALQTPLLGAVVDERAREVLSLLGGLLMIVGVSGGFLLWHLYSSADAAHERNTQRAALRAKQHQAQMQVANLTTDRVLRDTAAAVAEVLPEHSTRQAAQNSQRIMDQMITADGVNPTAAPERNGASR
jgi:hypothetical protein